MKKTKIITLLLIAACSISIASTKDKVFKKTFKTTPDQKIEISGPSGTKMFVAAWDKDEVQLDLTVSIVATKDKIEKDYIENFGIEEYRSGSSLVIEIVEPDADDSWSLWDLITTGHISVQTNVRGTIYVPAANPLELEFKYGELRVENVTGELVISGRSSELEVKGCTNLKEVSNQYGESEIKECAGTLEFEGRSAPINIFDFAGDLKVDADYAETSLKNIEGNILVDARGTVIKADHIIGNLSIDAPYTEIDAQRVSGLVEIDGRSAGITVSDAGGLSFNGQYCNLRCSDITGAASQTIAIYNKSGEIQLSKAVGNVLIDDTYSDITLKSITGNVNLSARSNTIRAEKITGNWYSTSQYTTMLMKKITADSVSIENRSNDVEVEFRTSPQFVQLENEYGGVRLTFPKSFEAGYDLKATYGEINSEFPIAFKTTTNGVISNTERKEGDSYVKVEVRSGNINLKAK